MTADDAMVERVAQAIDKAFWPGNPRWNSLPDSMKDDCRRAALAAIAAMLADPDALERLSTEAFIRPRRHRVTRL